MRNENKSRPSVSKTDQGLLYHLFLSFSSSHLCQQWQIFTEKSFNPSFLVLLLAFVVGNIVGLDVFFKFGGKTLSTFLLPRSPPSIVQQWQSTFIIRSPLYTFQQYWYVFIRNSLFFHLLLISTSIIIVSAVFLCYNFAHCCSRHFTFRMLIKNISHARI